MQQAGSLNPIFQSQPRRDSYMKLNLKMIAAAVALVATGSSQAAFTNAATSTGSSLALLAYNTVTNAYYVRDLGITLNSFLPSSITTSALDNGGVAAIGNKTPEAGLTLDKTNTASFADSAFSTWMSGQSASDIRWTVTAGDSLSSSTTGVARLLLTSSTTPALVSNGTVRNAVVAANGVTALVAQNPGMGLSATGATVIAGFSLGNTILQPLTLSSLDVASSLYYFSATTVSGSSGIEATTTKFGNSAGAATVLLLVEISDVIFAVDSIPAIFAVTQEPFLVFTSNAFAILGLRALYF
ncbi:MAG: hypothetical protein QFE16_16945, partial [Pseudomonadota bacterium]|nr:hypothetical protein [Pseudomonadota bacterium]